MDPLTSWSLLSVLCTVFSSFMSLVMNSRAMLVFGIIGYFVQVIILGIDIGKGSVPMMIIGGGNLFATLILLYINLKKLREELERGRRTSPPPSNCSRPKEMNANSIKVVLRCFPQVCPVAWFIFTLSCLGVF